MHTHPESTRAALPQRPALRVVEAKQRVAQLPHALGGDLGHCGALVLVGRDAGVVQAGRIRFSGRLAFFAWGILHSLYVPGWRNRLSVDLNWIWSYATHRRAALLLVAEPTPSRERIQPLAAASGAPAAAASPPEDRRRALAKGGGLHAR